MRIPPCAIALAFCVCCALAPLEQQAAAGEPFRITVIDGETGRGIPLVQLTTTNSVVYITDSAGVVAFDEPGLMNQRVFFTVTSHGYQHAADGFGMRGKALNVSAGGSAILRMKRINVAERLYRVTGLGIYRDSIILRDKPPTERPILNGLVSGQDSVHAIPYHGKLFWLWGDTSRPAYPLGNFAVTAATSVLPVNGGLDPEIGVNLNYFVNRNGFVKRMCPIDAPGPVWIDALMKVADQSGTVRLLGHYVRVKTLGTLYEQGIVLYDDNEDLFKPIAQFDLDAKLFARGHPIRVSRGGIEYFYFPASFPDVRVRAEIDAVTDPTAYEAFTCLAPGARYDKEHPALDRDSSGGLIWAWKPDTAPISQAQQQELIEAGLMEPQEGMWHLRDVETGRTILAHANSISFNRYRNRWIMIVCQSFGMESMLGEIWFAEADTPLGPWVYARKVVTHDHYSFYNPTQHPYFDQDDGRIIYFEGTYTSMFSSAKTRTPRYDYNQIMYRLALDDPRLALPTPVYRIPRLDGYATYSLQEDLPVPMNDSRQPRFDLEIAFMAIPRGQSHEGLTPVYGEILNKNGRSSFRLSVGSAGESRREASILFYALPVDSAAGNNVFDAAPDGPSAEIVSLYEYTDQSGVIPRYTYSPDAKLVGENLMRSADPLCRVWRSPVKRFHFANVEPVAASPR